MQDSWEIDVDWQSLEDGEPEEAACFAEIGMRAYGVPLTQGHDKLLNSLKQAPLLSGYHLALWFASNWWRLRWEPRRKSTAWALAHSMASIGEGYIWPDIDFASDGRFVLLNARPTMDRPGTPFRYITPETTSVIAAAKFEAVVDEFVATVVQRLRDCCPGATALDATWAAVGEERASNTVSAKRKLEALLGLDPDDMDDGRYAELQADGERIGVTALQELAAASEHGAIPTAGELQEMGRASGHPCGGFVRFGQAAPVRANEPPMAASGQAWQAGGATARWLRDQQRLGADPITNRMLSELCGLQPRVLQKARTATGPGLAFLARGMAGKNCVVLRAKREEGRRFELARLLGDELMREKDEPLKDEPFSLATRSYTYRQKAQRAFAAELLSPFQAVDGMLDGDYSEEAQQDVAAHFNVSAVAIRTQLANHERIDRFEPEWGAAGAGLRAAPGVRP
ncbi:hypothetical protein Veis_0594 [Verminephrobacter eiseniae EF01-2]|uniref:IrrE N-terminal-like domain-containing protein n=2 Tax=Verminephrobacter eiseniae TaxID=364317 RepID=A1WFH0_VEREI|nr:hypothetical protein Veis_0594 [Verminephrobacter eiseniae EF01-2]MCW5286739.1 hypothetical protein [Verminephrobacter eiseniae]MCW5305036.1 hypothetical protein [Verminephrobacter eiseniae]MCW8180976.1 hypothetical protein [Verminephrobacter eiseniae]MCW8190144.1 hypothetical protein [Verminephrobacter eiseniae]